MKYIMIAAASLLLAGCATTETTPAPAGATKGECVRRTGSNICSKESSLPVLPRAS